ncbi:glutamate ABC transporter substrate-binding protein [Nocardioides sp. InS609-2]|uniref:glutamate ABC transporter substrate-binding protein n=1 Tax=Nocardioides sp. InS609-2 TaxID=2760705 RepID=UPI0020BE5DEF|nr:glutamate ABC transporter substrate-binding protein [Nocardioides sp. InS609-2]
MSRTQRWRRLGAALGAATAVSLALAGCGSDNEADSSAGELSGIFADAPVADDAAIGEGTTMAAIKERGELVVAAALDAPLLSQQDPTNPDDVEGFDITLAKLLATYILGEPNVKIVPPASETREALLQNGTVDVVFNTYTITEERAEQISFAGPYFMSGLAVAVAVPAGEEDITGIDDLDGRKVIVGANTPAVEAVPEHATGAELVTFATDPQAVQALLQGRGDAYVQDYLLLATNAASNSDLKVAGEPFTEEPYGIGLPPDDADFKAFVNDWLLEIQEGGQWAQAFEDSIGTAVGSAAPTPPAIGSVPGS